MESKAEILVGFDKVIKEFQALLQDRENLSPKEAYEIRQYAKARTRLEVRVEELSGEEIAWREIYYSLDKQFAEMLGPEKKRDMNGLEEQIDTAKIVASALERLGEKPLWKRTWISAQVWFWKRMYRIAKYISPGS